jgi:dolichol-phosphate mannosyltransferase
VKLSVVIPAHNEEGAISETVEAVAETLKNAGIEHEILVVNDNSSDGTESVLRRLSADNPTVRYVNSRVYNGFGRAIRTGLYHFTGDAVVIVMGDGSDSPEDVVRYYRKLEEGYECAFGSRFIKGSRIVDYPRHKLLMNRLANFFVRSLFAFRYNDTTNAFKMYRREVIEGAQPLISPHFNLTVELPLKAIIRGYTYAVLPISWTNRKTGFSKLKLREMGSRYLFIVLYLFLEKHLSRGDYYRAPSKEERAVSTHSAQRSGE